MTAHTVRRFRSFRELGDLSERDQPVATLFSGGLDSSYLLLRMAQMGFTNMHALSVDVGELEQIREKESIAGALGARLHVVDARTTFAEEFVGPAIKAHAIYLDTHPVSSSLSRPLMARVATELAEEIGARTIVHTANRSQNSLRRLNGALFLLGWTGAYGSPYEMEPVSRADKLKELHDAGVTFDSDRTVSGDSNLWCREFESGSLDDPENHHTSPELYEWSVPGPRSLRDESIEISFRHGLPARLGGQDMPLRQLIENLNMSAGRYGVGRYSGLEHLDDGSKVLEVREMPAASLILRSLRHLEGACLTAEVLRSKLSLEQLWVREAVEGRWFGTLRAATAAFINACSDQVNGTVRWRAVHGVLSTSSIRADAPLYVRDREAWESEQIHREMNHYRAVAG
jgi:argininosuccinate synthase